MKDVIIGILIFIIFMGTIISVIAWEGRDYDRKQGIIRSEYFACLNEVGKVEWCYDNFALQEHQ